MTSPGVYIYIKTTTWQNGRICTKFAATVGQPTSRLSPAFRAVVSDLTIKNSKLKFEEFGFEPQLLEGLKAMGFETPTPIQEKAIPLLLEGKDILACAQTGTGKTAAFLLPIINKNIAEPNRGIDTIILEPTRELAVQVDQQLEGFAYFAGLSCMAIYGGRDGLSMNQEMKALKQGADIIVATPGRLLAHLQLGYVDLSTIRHFVLDEADRMLDMGFVTDIMSIVNKLPRKRQNLLFSATMPQDIRRFAKNILRNPAEVNIAISKPADGITQAAYFLKDNQKNDLIEYLLKRQNKARKILVFASSKKSTKELSAHLTRAGFLAAEIHSDLDQNQREETLLNFRNNNVPILVATDVLSRGIDIKGIDVVINYDVPGDPEDYVHRIGRTARADATGLAITLVTPATKNKFDRIEKLTGMKVPIIPLPAEIGQTANNPRSSDTTPQKNRVSGHSNQPRRNRNRSPKSASSHHPNKRRS